MNKDETLRLALKALKETWYHVGTFAPTNEAIELYDKAITALRLAIDVENMASESTYKEQLETKDEPVAWMYWQSCLNDDGTQTSPWVQRYSKFKPTESVINKDITPLYTATPQRTWVGLDTDEFKFIASKYLLNREVGLEYFQEEIEDKLKELNT